jgi:hypothetical protein
MSRLRALRAAFGIDRQATDIADGLSVAWSRENVGKILSAMKKAGQSYRGPRGVMGPLYNLSRIARRAFAPVVKRPKINGLNGSPDQP